jgi:sn1-specific diacylglycerol lipase
MIFGCYVCRHGVLDKLLLEEDSPLSGYKLILTGHSLGAGCAAVLSLMLKSKYPDLKCLCFSPPGCTLSENMAESCKEYLTSYVLDDDIIPRLSLQSMEHLRDSVLEMIARIKVTKRQALCAKRTNDMILHTRESIPPSKFSEQLAEFHAHNETRKEENPMLNVPLYPPGKIVHLVKMGEKQSCLLSCKTAGHVNPYTATWVEASDLGEVIISSHLLDDHNPLNVLNELERIADTCGLSPPYTIPKSTHVDS